MMGMPNQTMCAPMRVPLYLDVLSTMCFAICAGSAAVGIYHHVAGWRVTIDLLIAGACYGQLALARAAEAGHPMYVALTGARDHAAATAQTLCVMLAYLASWCGAPRPLIIACWVGYAVTGVLVTVEVARALHDLVDEQDG